MAASIYGRPAAAAAFVYVGRDTDKRETSARCELSVAAVCMGRDLQRRDVSTLSLSDGCHIVSRLQTMDSSDMAVVSWVTAALLFRESRNGRREHLQQVTFAVILPRLCIATLTLRVCRAHIRQARCVPTESLRLKDFLKTS
jgi:hypothetical protein